VSILFPRLPRPVAAALFAEVDSLKPDSEHHGQIFAPVGGQRATPVDVKALGQHVRDLASSYGFPFQLAPTDRLSFDRRTATLLVEQMQLSWSEAAAADMWSFVALVALPDVTRWRFGIGNVERWIATDLTRHTWARAWWRGTVFGERPELLDLLTESDLNQIMERRVIGGDPRLAANIAEALLEADANAPGHRRALIRDAAARLRRRLAFIDARALDDSAIRILCHEMMRESARLLPQDAEAQWAYEETD
jgi:hypothetical protein